MKTYIVDRPYDARPAPDRTLRWAVENARPGDRILVQCAEPVRLTAPLQIATHDLAINGGYGADIVGGQVTVSAALVRLEGLRFRYAAELSADAVTHELHRTGGGGWRSLVLADVQDITIKHCLIADSTDDNLSISGEACRRILIEDSILCGGRGLWRKCALVGDFPDDSAPAIDDDHLVTFRRCLFTDFDYRGPKIRGGRAHVLNCVMIGAAFGNELRDYSGTLAGNWLTGRPGLLMRSRPFTAVDTTLAAEAVHLADNYVDGSPLADPWSLLGPPGQTRAHTSAHWRRSAAHPGLEWTDPREAFLTVMQSAGTPRRSRREREAVHYAEVVDRIGRERAAAAA